MENKNEYVNPFVDIHKKVQALKARAHETNVKDAKLREERAIQATR